MSAFVGFVTADGKLQLDHRAAFVAYTQRFKGEEVELEIRKRRTKRSERQNRALHAMLAPWALSEGHDIEDLKDDVLGAVFGYREVVSPITGEVRHVLAEPHTSTLTVAQFVELMDRAVEIAASCGVILELPDEYIARQKAEQRARAKKETKAA